MITTLRLINPVNHEEFLKLVAANPELQLERTSTGDLVIMPPTGGETGDHTAEITTQLRV